MVPTSLWPALLDIAAKTAAMGIGGAAGAFLVLGFVKALCWLKQRA